jgi:two-component system, LytTR family, sensor kinase
MALVGVHDCVHAGCSDMPRSLEKRLRGLAIIAGVWTIVAMYNGLATSLRTATGELAPSSRWVWVSLVIVLLWTAATPPILALSRRFPLERGTWHIAVVAHAAMLLVVFAADGWANGLLPPASNGRQLTFWQHMWRYTFINSTFYGGVVAVEHARRYYRLYLERRVRESELEAQVSRAQLQALQMQIHPHFLFNTLNTISGMVRIDDKAAAIEMLAGLGDMLRMLLHSDGAQEVPVRQEIQLVERYLQIEQVRFRDRLSVEVRVEPGVENALVPNLILQPLVENAVRHGIRARSGQVRVEVERAGATLRMEVRDSGDDELRDESERSGNGVGLANTRARLEQLYGEDHRFELTHGDAGTSAVIEIPLRRSTGVRA